MRDTRWTDIGDRMHGILSAILILGPLAAGAAASDAAMSGAPPNPSASTADSGGEVRFVRHDPPEAAVDFSPFEDAGCPGPSRECERTSPLAALGCDRIAEPPALLGALRPSHPMAWCLVEPLRDPGGAAARIETVKEEGFLYASGGLRPVYSRLAVFRDGRFERIKDRDELRATFAPIESGPEALAYALAATGLTAGFSFEPEPHYEYFVDRLEDTHVIPDGIGGHRVQLFHVQVFGCGPKPISAVELAVSPEGSIEELRRIPVFKDPRMDGICVD